MAVTSWHFKSMSIIEETQHIRHLFDRGTRSRMASAGEQGERLLGDDGEVRGRTPAWDVRIASAYVVIGMAMLWPFNSFITASDFFDRVFAGDDRIRQVYASAITSVFTTGSFAAVLYTTLTIGRADLDRRVRLACASCALAFAALCLATALLSTTHVYFAIVTATVLVTAIATGVLQTSAFAAAGQHGNYVPYILIGQGVAGLLPAGLTLVTALLSSGASTGRAVACFATSIVIAVACYGAQAFLVRKTGEEVQAEQLDVTKAQITTFLHDFFPWAVFMTFAITLSIFPSVTAAVTSDRLRAELFVPLGFLVWNGGDLAGRVVAPIFPIRNGRILLLLALARVIFLPLVYMHLGDILFLFYMSAFGLTNGYVGANTMDSALVAAPTQLKRQVGAGMSFMLCLGLIAGSFFSFFT